MLGEKLIKLREKEGLTQSEVAKIFNAQQASYSKWELNQRNPSYDTLKLIASHYGVTIDYLLDHKCKSDDKWVKIGSELTPEQKIL